MCMCLTIINNSCQHAALFLAGVSVVGQTLQVSEAGRPLGAGRTLTGLVLHIGLLTVSPARTRPAGKCAHKINKINEQIFEQA